MTAHRLKFGTALERAAGSASRFALIIGDNERPEGEWTLKKLATSEQQKHAPKTSSARNIQAL